MPEFITEMFNSIRLNNFRFSNLDVKQYFDILAGSVLNKFHSPIENNGVGCSKSSSAVILVMESFKCFPKVTIIVDATKRIKT